MVKSDGSDAADRGCQIVLRTLAQPSGLPSHKVDGVNWVVFEGLVDIAAGADDGDVLTAVLFESPFTDDWLKVYAEPIGGAPVGYRRQLFTLDRYTVPMGDNSSWRSMRIQVIPFLERGDGSRLFDHNRLSGDFENYVLTKDQTSYGDDPAVCH